MGANMGVMPEGFEEFSGPPTGGRVKQWLGGMAVPVFLVLYGWACLRSGEAELSGRNGTAVFRGEAATALSWAYISIGAFLHFHYFWALNTLLERFSGGLKGSALVAFLGFFCYALAKHLHFLQ